MQSSHCDSQCWIRRFCTTPDNLRAGHKPLSFIRPSLHLEEDWDGTFRWDYMSWFLISWPRCITQEGHGDVAWNFRNGRDGIRDHRGLSDICVPMGPDEMDPGVLMSLWGSCPSSLKHCRDWRGFWRLWGGEVTSIFRKINKSHISYVLKYLNTHFTLPVIVVQEKIGQDRNEFLHTDINTADSVHICSEGQI